MTKQIAIDSTPAAAQEPSKFAEFLATYATQLSVGPAIAALLGSLYFSEIRGFVPCELCWYQRILMYPITILLIVGIFNDDWLLPKYILPFSITGLGVSIYHYLLQNHVFGASMCSAGVSCAVRYINVYGFITIPFLAGVAFLLITILMLGANWAYKRVPLEID
ncbi:MAG TPA: disulfide oxidoreductase [Anaerolineales bacterium]|nr:disulfide oxidoreductase [Anaerolineales bacterium]